MYQGTSLSQCSKMKFGVYCDQQNAFFYGAYRKQVANISSVMEGFLFTCNVQVLNVGNMNLYLKKEKFYFCVIV